MRLSSRLRKERSPVYIEDQDHTISFTVEDTGIGIPADMLEAIFDRFSQVDGSASRSHEGTGIGLSLAKEIVTIHRGTDPCREQTGQRGPIYCRHVERGCTFCC